ncbi:D-glycero-beta-D-manno-heptose 1-phosphate adenylyltransferase [Streptomyces sp. DT171]|uniref:D-glycero-beta-D-manno-heptose 1-phosphate adenylyltransferase n=1 Tax=Streptomyces sp. DT171 TaxID=3416524 RepID=UPI003CF66B8A
MLVVGDALLDRDISGRAERLAPDAPVPVVGHARRDARPGGAALAAYLAAADGRDVTLVTALGADEASDTLRELLRDRVRLVEIPLRGQLSCKTRLMADGRPLLRLDDGDGRAGGATEAARAAVAAARAVLVADYGRGTADALRDALTRRAARVPVVWDPHPAGGPPVRGTCLATPAASEARRFAAAHTDTRTDTDTDTATPFDTRTDTDTGTGTDTGTDTGTEAPSGAAGRPIDDRPRNGERPRNSRRSRNGERPADAGRPATDAGRPATAPPHEPRGRLGEAAHDARVLLRAWDVTSVVVTLGEHGALLSHGETPLLVPAPWRAQGDPCGAGDRFAVTAAGMLADGALPEDAVRGAVDAATRYVTDGGAHALIHDDALATRPGVTADGDAEDDALDMARRVRAAGGTVVAAGGCFDLLHAGHVELLQAARRVGDCLLVCVNSDASVRRRKGGGRPVVPAADRVRVLRALECVDAVAVFDEDTPERLLDELRPHVWAKGGDYALSDLPEAALLESWGGQVVLLPYLDGRSSTRLVERAARPPATTSRGGHPDATADRLTR